MSVVVTRSSRNTQASAIWASFCPRTSAISLSARRWVRVFSLSWSLGRLPSRAMRESSGMFPSRYLSVSSPCARAVNAMIPMPFSSAASTSSGSIQRLSIE